MCGINGIYGLRDLDKSKSIIGKMNADLAHRGPDAEGELVEEGIALGHKRLAIIDLVPASNQPMTDPSGRYTLVFNGEIYNYQKIKSWIGDYSFKTQSDTEVVLAAFIKWGPECLKRFNGMFAFAVWDNETRSLFIARDRVGIKPLYYKLESDFLIFSSEIRPIIKSGLFTPKLDKNGLNDYVRYQTVHAPNTIVEGVKMLMPGHYMTINESDYAIQQYWDVRTASKLSNKSLNKEAAQKLVLDQLRSSVESRLQADVSFGAFLSGGIDSSAVVALMAETASKKVKTFSVTFEEEAFSEARYAKIIADKYQTDHTEIKLTPGDFLKDIPDALSAMDHPSGDGPNTFVISKAVKAAGVSMALSGLGGDELFAGYDVFKRSKKLLNNKWAMSFAPGFRKLVAKPVKWRKKSAAGDKFEEILMLDYWDIDHTYPVSRKVLSQNWIDHLLEGHNNHKNEVFDIANSLIAYGSGGFELPDLSKVSVCEMQTYMQNVLLRDTDQMSMAHALELRVPFLDHELVEQVIGMSDDVKFPNSPKQLLVEALGDYLPSEVVNRPKMGFTFPWEHWLKKELRDLVESNLESLGNRSILNKAALQELWERFLNGDKRITWSRIWYLVVLESWLTNNGINE